MEIDLENVIILKGIWQHLREYNVLVAASFLEENLNQQFINLYSAIHVQLMCKVVRCN